MRHDLIAKASTTIRASPEAVWDALVNPDSIRKYMTGTTVTTSWGEGCPIYWSCKGEGKSYEEKGIVLYVSPPHNLEYSHYSPLSGQPDVPGSYHTVSIQLKAQGRQTRVLLKEDNNPSRKICDYSRKHCEQMLKGLKRYVEK